MYAGHGFRDFEIGDVDVVKLDGVYHLFHLTLPNHDYIAHAISDDGLKWRRVKNALFIGDPQAWDDDMLWTMHVTRDPFVPGGWRMFYTGLCLRERGRLQRVGMARSDDLYTWDKVEDGFPLEIPGPHYEYSLEEGRHWVSFRDPFLFQEDDRCYLLAAARVNSGPIIRRGCVAFAEETSENCFSFRKPLFHPHRYDDLEVPNLVKLQDRYYLIGSTREDIKVHYWVADALTGPYRNFHDNVLLPQGNYAARVAEDGERLLVWNFFFRGLEIQGEHLLAPPKELVVRENGELRLQSFAGFEDLVTEELALPSLLPLQPLFENPSAHGETEELTCWFGTDSGMEVFALQGDYRHFIMSGTLELEGDGKAGLVLRVNDEGDGYFLSLDLAKGIAQIRAWGHKEDGGIEEAFYYEQLQAAHVVPAPGPHSFRLLAYEQYLEFSLDGYVLLSLADREYEQGRIGFYVESARLRVDDLVVKVCRQAAGESYPGGLPNY